MRPITISITLIATHTGLASAELIIYSDDFSGTGSSGLNGTLPAGTGAAGGTFGATWTASPDWSDAGVKSGASFAGAYLPFTPTDGFVYTLELGMDITNTTDRFFGVGFMETNNTAFSPQDNNASAWALLRGDVGNPDNEISYFGGPGLGARTDISTTTLNPSGSGIFEIVLNTQIPQ